MHYVSKTPLPLFYREELGEKNEPILIVFSVQNSKEI